MPDDTLAAELYRSARPGEIITFGTYPQTADGTDSTPIKWRVLRNSGRELFVLSEYILDCKRYHGEYVAMTWRDCALRQWLNDAFYQPRSMPPSRNSSRRRVARTMARVARPRRTRFFCSALPK